MPVIIANALILRDIRDFLSYHYLIELLLKNFQEASLTAKSNKQGNFITMSKLYFLFMISFS